MIFSSNTIAIIKENLTSELPGRDSHIKMAPIANNELFRPFDPPSFYKESGVLIPLYFNEKNELEIILTLRSNDLKHHSGQISFPGGRRDKGETLEETALRETWEEIGIPSQDIEILGALSTLYVPPSNAVIHPFVGFITNLGSIKINPDEVDEVIIISVNDLLDKDNYRKTPWDFSGKIVDVPYWDIKHRVPLWGATAMILQEFIDILIKHR
jgi:8-oxo-dGTP pyrophosphatase MutT (NUDIX family)